MKMIQGIGASEGIIMGTVYLYQKSDEIPPKCTVKDTGAELLRLKNAQKKTIDYLNGIYQTSLKQVGEKDSLIFQIHIMMLQDDDYVGEITEKIKNDKICAEYAVYEVGNEFAERFSHMKTEYLRGRKADVLDTSRSLIQCLQKGCREDLSHLSKSVILAAEELAPSETVQLDKDNVLAIITQRSSKTSHSAILAQTMGIPSVAGLGDSFSELKDGMNIIVDGASGEIILEPDEQALSEYREKRKAYVSHADKLKQLLNVEIVTRSGRKIQINANIGQPSDVERAQKYGAQGIGLFRSEFLYMGRNSLPTEEEQFQAYKRVLSTMKTKPVIVRTFDIGADKQVPYLNLPKEDNPALGYRAIRICLDKKELFLTQLRALLRASAFGNLKIMLPMIISADEIKATKKMIEKVKTDLITEKIAFDANVQVGIMIETPAAVMLSEELAQECDFFSIGTNDLTQYTLAIDRTNEKMEKLYSQKNPAVLRMIEITVKNAHKAGIPVGICGKSAADAQLTPFYLRIGINELSAAPSSLLELKDNCLKLIAEHPEY